MEANGLSCVIAAGGTAGHVLPALAVADQLRNRGVRVTFAGSPDRAEAPQALAAAKHAAERARQSPRDRVE